MRRSVDTAIPIANKILINGSFGLWPKDNPVVVVAQLANVMGLHKREPRVSGAIYSLVSKVTPDRVEHQLDHS